MLELLKKIEDIPELPQVAYKIISEAAKDNADYEIFSRYVEASPALTFKIFQIINSPFYGLPNKITNLSQAIGLLGIQKIKNLSLTIFILEVINDISNIDQEVVLKWKFLITTANAAKIISKDETLFLAALVSLMPDYLAAIFKKGNLKFTKDSYLEALFILAQKWYLPSSVTDIVRNYYKLKFKDGNNFGNGAINIFLSESIANILLLNGVREEFIEKIKKFIKIDDEQFLKLIKEIDVNSKQIWRLFKLDDSKIDYSDIVYVFSKANSKIHKLLVENEELLDKYTEANNILNTALNNAPIGVLMFENDKLVLINHQAEKIILKEVEELNDIFDNEVITILNNEENNNIHLVTELVNKTPVELMYVKIPGDSKKELLFLKDLRTEYKLKKQYKNLKENFASIINSSAIGICLLNTKGNVIFVNEKFCKIFKEKSEKFLGKKIYEVICVSEICMNKINPVLSSILNEKILEHKTEVISKDSDENKLHLEIMITPYREGRYIAGFQFLVNDITDKKELELENLRLQDEFIRLEKDKIAVELAGATAHELNQPLTSLLLSIEILTMKSGEENKHLKTIKAAGEKIAEIVKKLGDITRYESRKYIGTHDILDLDKSNE